MTSVGTKNGSIVVKDGKVAENCNCCGEWWCYVDDDDCSPFCSTCAPNGRAFGSTRAIPALLHCRVSLSICGFSGVFDTTLDNSNGAPCGSYNRINSVYNGTAAPLTKDGQTRYTDYNISILFRHNAILGQEPVVIVGVRGSLYLVPNNDYGITSWVSVNPDGSQYISSAFASPSSSSPYCYNGLSFGPYALASGYDAVGYPPCASFDNSVSLLITGAE